MHFSDTFGNGIIMFTINIINVYSISGNLTCQNIYCIFYIIFYHCYYNNLCMLVHGVLDM